MLAYFTSVKYDYVENKKIILSTESSGITNNLHLSPYLDF